MSALAVNPPAAHALAGDLSAQLQTFVHAISPWLRRRGARARARDAHARRRVALAGRSPRPASLQWAPGGVGAQPAVPSYAGSRGRDADQGRRARRRRCAAHRRRAHRWLRGRRARWNASSTRDHAPQHRRRRAARRRQRGGPPLGRRARRRRPARRARRRARRRAPPPSPSGGGLGNLGGLPPVSQIKHHDEGVERVAAHHRSAAQSPSTATSSRRSSPWASWCSWWAPRGARARGAHGPLKSSRGPSRRRARRLDRHCRHEPHARPERADASADDLADHAGHAGRTRPAGLRAARRAGRGVRRSAGADVPAHGAERREHGVGLHRFRQRERRGHQRRALLRRRGHEHGVQTCVQGALTRARFTPDVGVTGITRVTRGWRIRRGSGGGGGGGGSGTSSGPPAFPFGNRSR